MRRWRKRGGSKATLGGVGGGVMLPEYTMVDIFPRDSKDVE